MRAGHQPGSLSDTRKVVMRTAAIAVVALFLVVGAGVIWASYSLTAPQTAGWESFAQMAGVGLTLLTALLTAATGFVVLAQQSRTARELETLRSRLATDLEFVRRRLSAEATAFDALHRAATVYYYVLAALETGELDEAGIREAERGMAGASTYLPALARVDADIWQSFWQRARFVREEAQRLTGTDERRQLWADQVQALGSLLNQFREAITARLRSEP